MTHFLPPCCCTEAISRLPASSLCSIRQADGGVFVCSHWFPHTPCCQDTERRGRADSSICTLQDHCLARTLAWHVYMPETKAHGKTHESMRKAALNCCTNGHSCMCSMLRFVACALIRQHLPTCTQYMRPCLLLFAQFFQPLPFRRAQSHT